MLVKRHHFATIGSTNTWAKENAHTFDRYAITVVTADEQTSGRGRFLRRWESPANQNIYASFCFFVDTYSAAIGNIAQILALSAAQVLEAMGFQPILKWPNDVLLSNKKIAGILCETTLVDQQAICVVAGIGINVNMPQGQLEQIDRPATSLYAEKNVIFEIPKVMDSLQTKFMTNKELFDKNGFIHFLPLYRDLIGRPGQIRFNDNHNVWCGNYHSILDDGSLNLELLNGQIKNFLVGEILW